MDESAALQPFCLLAKSAKGAACASLIKQVLDHPSIFVFGELLDMPSVKELEGTPFAPQLELLRLFAYGTWNDYKARAAQLPALSEAQVIKLKKLSLVSLAAQSRTIPYAVLMRDLEVNSIRQVEDLLIECLYGGLLYGRLDQQASQLEVTYCTGRDIHPSEVAAMCETLGAWHKSSIEVMRLIHEKLERHKLQAEQARAAQAEHEQRIDAVKANIRANHDAGDSFSGGGDFDVGMDYEDEKMRKSGRAKNKHAMGVGPRK